MDLEIKKIIFEGNSEQIWDNGNLVIKRYPILQNTELKNAAKILISYLEKQYEELNGCEAYIDKSTIFKNIKKKNSEIYSRLNEEERSEVRKYITGNRY